MVKSEQIYSPQQYLMTITGNCYAIRGANDIETIQSILEDHGFELWDYPITEIDHIVEHQLNVVLVDCMVSNDKTYEFEHHYRWFEVPEDFK
jgi:hypothetical protein